MTRSPDSVEALVRRVLDGVVDPCSASAGVPAGLVDMGLVQRVDVAESPAGALVRVTLRLTNGLCMLGAVLAREAEDRLAGTPGVAAATVSIDSSHVWREADMAPPYRTRLSHHRRLAAERRAAGRSG